MSEREWRPPKKVHVLGLRTPNPLNGSHRHWATKAKLRKGQRETAYMVAVTLGPVRLIRGLSKGVPWKAIVTITRVAPSRGLDPHDGLGASLKGVVDGVADALGVDDRDPRVTWRFEQRRGPWAVEIEVE